MRNSRVALESVDGIECHPDEAGGEVRKLLFGRSFVTPLMRSNWPEDRVLPRPHPMNRVATSESDRRTTNAPQTRTTPPVHKHAPWIDGDFGLGDRIEAGKKPPISRTGRATAPR